MNNYDFQDIEAKAEDSIFSIPEKKLRVYCIGMSISPFVTCAFYQLCDFLVRLFLNELTPLNAVLMFVLFSLSVFIAAVQFWYVWKNKEVLR